MSLKNRFNKTRFRNKKFIKNVYVTGKGRDFRIRFVSKEIFDKNAHIYYDYELHSIVNKEGYQRFYRCLGWKNNCPACQDASDSIDAEKKANIQKKEAWKKVKRRWATYYGYIYIDGKRELALIHIPDFTYLNDKSPTPNQELQSKLVGIEKTQGIDVFDSVEGRDIIIKNKGEQNAIVTKIDFDPKSKNPLTKEELEALNKAKSLEDYYLPLDRITLLSIIQKVPKSEVKDFHVIKKEREKDVIEKEKIEIPLEEKKTEDSFSKEESKEKTASTEDLKETAKEEKEIDGEKINIQVEDINIDLDSFFEDDKSSLDDKFNDIMDE